MSPNKLVFFIFFKGYPLKRHAYLPSISEGAETIYLEGVSNEKNEVSNYS